MKEQIRYSCGHEGEVNLYNGYSNEVREKKLQWFREKGLCPDCYRKKREEESNQQQKAEAKRINKEEAEKKKKNGCREVEMTYFQYKNEYEHCEMKEGSYDKDRKTIVVYVPIVLIPPIEKCPTCGSRKGCIRQRVFGERLLEITFDGEKSTVKSELENFHAKNITQYVYCAQCQRRLFKVTEDMKLEE